MERTISVEEKIRRAEEIYARRRQEENRPIAKVNVNNKKDIKLLRKMIIQILVCVAIYLIVYTINNNQYIFSEDFIKRVNEILSKDTNFIEIYNKVEETVKLYLKGSKDNENNSFENGILESEENSNDDGNDKTNENQNEANKEESEKENEANTDKNNEEIKEADNLSSEEIDIINVKNTTSFIKPIEGKISSGYGKREPTTTTVPKNHTGTDIAANFGTVIKSSTDGEVVMSSEEGDYRKAFKNSNWRS